MENLTAGVAKVDEEVRVTNAASNDAVTRGELARFDFGAEQYACFKSISSSHRTNKTMICTSCHTCPLAHQQTSCDKQVKSDEQKASAYKARCESLD